MDTDTVDQQALTQVNVTATRLAHELKNHGWDPNSLRNRDAAGWVGYALDPADSVGSNGAVLGIPDHNDQPSTCIFWRQLEQLAPQAALELTDTDTWDCDLLTFEGPYALCAYQMRKTSDPTKFYNGWFVNRMFNFESNGTGLGPGPLLALDAELNDAVVTTGPASKGTNWQQNVGSFRPLGSSLTMEFVGATLTDQGTLAAAQFPNLWATSMLSQALGNAGSWRYRETGSPGSYAINSASRTTPVSICTWGEATEVGPTGLQQSVNVPKIDNILMVAPGSRTWKASKGVYMPLRYTQPNLAFTNATGAGAILGFQHPWDWSPAATLPERLFPVSTSITGNPIVGCGSNLMRAGAVCVRGLAPTTTFSLCFRTGVEILPTPGSPWAANLTPSCTPEDAAVEAYFKLRHSLPDCFESSWNMLGLVSKTIGAATKAIGKAVSPKKEPTTTSPPPQTPNSSEPSRLARLAGKAAQGGVSLLQKKMMKKK